MDSRFTSTQSIGLPSLLRRLVHNYGTLRRREDATTGGRKAYSAYSVNSNAMVDTGFVWRPMHPSVSGCASTTKLSSIMDECDEHALPQQSAPPPAHDHHLERTYTLNSKHAPSIPDSVYRCATLTHIDCGDNCIQVLSPSIAALRYLQYLVLSRNRELARPCNLRMHAGTELHTLPDTLRQCRQLQYVDISFNPLTQVPPSLLHMCALTELCMRACRLRTLPKNIGALIELRHLDVGHNQLTSLPSTMDKLTRLHTLIVCNNRLRKLPSALCSLRYLCHLDGSWNELASMPELIGCLHSLETLDVRGNYLSQLPSSIDACARLEHVDIRDNRFTRLPYFDTRSLHTLLADSNQIGLIEDDIYRLCSLRVLSVRNNAITALSPNINTLCLLEQVYLDSNRLCILPRQICACRRLRILSLAQNHLTIMPDIFQLFTEMRVLDLRDNMLHSLPLTMLAIKHSLLALKLAHNQKSPVCPLLPTQKHAEGLVLTNVYLPQMPVEYHCEWRVPSTNVYENNNGITSGGPLHRMYMASLQRPHRTSTRQPAEHVHLCESWHVPLDQLQMCDREHRCRRHVALLAGASLRRGQPSETANGMCVALPTAVRRLRAPIRPYAMVDMEQLREQLNVDDKHMKRVNSYDELIAEHTLVPPAPPSIVDTTKTHTLYESML